MLYTVKKTLQEIKDKGNDVIVQVKGNQKSLYYDCLRLKINKFSDIYEEGISKGHGRIENRTVSVYNNFTILGNDKDVWKKYISCIVKVDRLRSVFKTKSKEWKNSYTSSYYISTKNLSANDFCKVIRSHWFIENKNHYIKDVSMGEDKSRIRVNANIFMRLRSFSLNILKLNNSKNINNEMFENSLNLDKVLNYKGIKNDE